MNLDPGFPSPRDNQVLTPSTKRRKKWVIGISVAVGVFVLVALVGQFSGLLGARLIRRGSPRLTVYQAESVTLEIPSSVSVQKLEICDDKETRILFGYRDFTNCSTLSYFVKPSTAQATVRIPTNYLGRAVVIVRQRGDNNQLLPIAPRDAKIALWVEKARPQTAQQADSGGGGGGGGGGSSDDGGGGGSDNQTSHIPQVAAEFLAPESDERVAASTDLDVRVQLTEITGEGLACQHWQLNGRVLNVDDWRDSESLELSSEPCN